MGTHYKGTRDEIRAIDAYIKLQRSAESSSARATQHRCSAAGCRIIRETLTLFPYDEGIVGAHIF
jgi:hypothetical protein